MGSTILAGDTCFSHAALLAARTDHPQVVAIFSQSLQNVSEKQLRILFDMQNAEINFDPSPELFQAGLQAASVLAKWDAAVYSQYPEMLKGSFAQVLHRKIISSDSVPLLGKMQQERWQALNIWYARQFSIG